MNLPNSIGTYVPSVETKRWHLLKQTAVAFLLLILAIFMPIAGLGASAILGVGMIIDAHQRFSVAQSLAATAVSTNVIDLGAERRIGSGKPMAIVIVVTTALDGGNADETYTATIQTDDNEAFASATTLAGTGAASLPRGSAAGTKFILPIPPGSATERYIRLNYTVGGTTPSGAVTAWLTSMDAIQNEAYYADAITISI
jgi:hypothetical protein